MFSLSLFHIRSHMPLKLKEVFSRMGTAVSRRHVFRLPIVIHLKGPLCNYSGGTSLSGLNRTYFKHCFAFKGRPFPNCLPVFRSSKKKIFVLRPKHLNSYLIITGRWLQRRGYFTRVLEHFLTMCPKITQVDDCVEGEFWYFST